MIENELQAKLSREWLQHFRDAVRALERPRDDMKDWERRAIRDAMASEVESLEEDLKTWDEAHA